MYNQCHISPTVQGSDLRIISPMPVLLLLSGASLSHFPPFLSLQKLGEVVGPLRLQDPLMSQKITSGRALWVATLDRLWGNESALYLSWIAP